MDFVGAIKAGFKNYANFTGVAGRSEYWYWYLFTVLCGIVLNVVDQFSDYAVLGTLFSLATLVPNLAVQVRRLRDAGHTWKWLLLGFGLSLIFIVGIIGIIVRVIALLPDMTFLSENMDPALLESQINILSSDPTFIAFALVLLFGLLLTVAYLVLMLVFLVQPSKSFAEGNKYLVAPTPEN